MPEGECDDDTLCESENEADTDPLGVLEAGRELVADMDKLDVFV